MKKRFLILVAAVCICCPKEVIAEENLCDGELHELDISFYNDNKQPCSTGLMPRVGVAAFDPAYYGYVAYIQFEDGSTMFVEILDTGGKKVRSGKRLDVWVDCSDQEAMELGVKKAKVQILKGDGKWYEQSYFGRSTN